MPLARDKMGGGMEADGSKSTKFCSHCYAGGKFTQPNITLSEMKSLVRGKLKEMGFPGLLAGFFTSGLPKLERWRKAS
jgi:hypothetical protein